MEMNVSTQEEQVVAKKSGGLNPAIVLPILLAIGVLIYLFVLGNPANFKADPRLTGGSVALADIESKELHRILYFYAQIQFHLMMDCNLNFHFP